MHRRLRGWRSVVLAAVLASAVSLVVPPPAGSAPPEDGHGSHVAGIGLDEPPGAPRSTPIPHLVRPGSERRPARSAVGEASTREAGPLAPVVLPPGAFDGVPDLAGASPADPTGALGITNHVAAVNVHMATFDRTGAPQFTDPKRLRSLDEQLPSGVQDFDPKVVYDPYDGVFLLTFASASATQSFLSIVVIPEGTEDDETQDGWCTLHMSGDQVAGDGKQMADYPSLGFTSNRVTLSTNQYEFDGALPEPFRYVQIVSMRKAHLYDCTVNPVPIDVFSRSQTRDPDGSRAFTIVPAISNGGDPAVQYLASLDANASTGKLILWRLRSVDGALRLGRSQVASQTMRLPPFGLQCGGSLSNRNTWWDTGDLRLTSAFWDADLGRLYTATAIKGNRGGGPIESLVKWWEVDPATRLSNSDVTRSGKVGAAGRDSAWPSVATDADGNVWLNYAGAGLDECLSAYAAVVHPAERSAEQAVYRVGEARYEFSTGDPERWGDYTAIARDPVVPTTVAVYGAYPLDVGAGATTDVWQQVIATLDDV
jgi:hypothetical protein